MLGNVMQSLTRTLLCAVLTCQDSLSECPVTITVTLTVEFVITYMRNRTQRSKVISMWYSSAGCAGVKAIMQHDFKSFEVTSRKFQSTHSYTTYRYRHSETGGKSIQLKAE